MEFTSQTASEAPACFPEIDLATEVTKVDAS